MSAPPDRPKIYHITHVDNLPGIVVDGGLLCDEEMSGRGGPVAMIGLPEIKAARLRMPVNCHPGDRVGEYVPFNFCPRSVMLYVVYRANHPGLVYRGGQEQIVHLEADFHAVVAWAEQAGRRWAVTASNARTQYTEARTGVEHLSDIDWSAVSATDFTRSEVKEAKQAEFLLQGSFPLALVERIGVLSGAVRNRVSIAFEGSPVQPPVVIMPRWYFP